MAREGITHGIRFPEWRGGTHTTFFYRLSQWGCSASGTDKGSEALDMAEVERRPDRATRFGNQFSTAVFGLLLDSRGPSEGEEALRAEIANEIMHGMSDEVRQAHYRLLQDSVNSVATGIATWATSYLGFGQTLESSLQFSGTTFALAAGVTAVRHVSLRFLNQRQQEARRQAGYWLNSLHAWMIGYVVWGQGAVRSGAYRGIDQVAYVADALVSKRARIPEGLPPDERIENDIQLLIDNAARVEDGDLEAALMRVQGVLRWGSEHLGSAIGNLVAVIQSVPGILDDAHSPLTLNEGETEPLRLPGSRAGQVSHFTTRPEA